MDILLFIQKKQKNSIVSNKKNLELEDASLVTSAITK